MSTSNAYARCKIFNDLPEDIEFVTFKHTYQEHQDEKKYDKFSRQGRSDRFSVGYWTGIFSAGKDYWQIKFLYKGYFYECKLKRRSY